MAIAEVAFQAETLQFMRPNYKKSTQKGFCNQKLFLAKKKTFSECCWLGKVSAKSFYSEIYLEEATSK
jgi:hypothetical protein